MKRRWMLAMGMLSLALLWTACTAADDPGAGGDDDADGCPPGSTDCAGDCVDLQSDRDHCGACGETCADDQNCVDGECVDCADECGSPGETDCAAAPDNGVLVCSNYDEDSCLEWGGYTECPADEVCADGACGPDCVDECTTPGETDCTAQQDGWVVCGDHDGDPCLEWSATTPCDPDEFCEDGECVEECIEPYEDCEDYDDCCDDGDDGYHCCPVLHICVPDWWT